MTQKHGRRFEHTLANGVDEITAEEIWVTTAGYSGNAKADDCDIVITVDPSITERGDPKQYNIEAKNKTVKVNRGNRETVFSGSKEGDSGLDELKGVMDGTPSWADPVVAISWSNCKLIVLDVRWLLGELGELDCAVPSGVKTFGARLTDSDNISMKKPTLDEWESATASDSDAVVLAKRLGLPYSEVEE